MSYGKPRIEGFHNAGPGLETLPHLFGPAASSESKMKNDLWRRNQGIESMVVIEPNAKRRTPPIRLAAPAQKQTGKPGTYM